MSSRPSCGSSAGGSEAPGVRRRHAAILEGATRARVTQIVGMLRLAPEIQERILALPPALHQTVSERVLRPVTQVADPRRQRVLFGDLLKTQMNLRAALEV